MAMKVEARPNPRPEGPGRTSPEADRRSRRVVAVAGLVVVAVGALLVLGLAAGSSGVLGAPRAAVLGAVEGITEFLPVSSTGHLLIAERLLGLQTTGRALDALNGYAIVIQGGAILAVAWLFRRRLMGAARALLAVVRPAAKWAAAGAEDRRVAVAIVLAAAPAGVIGLLAGDAAQEHLFSPVPIAVAWAVGGLALAAVAGSFRRRATGGVDGGTSLGQVTARQAMIVGAAQVLALWPGVSRSLVTIMAGCLAGLTVPAAVELSFLTGFVVLLGATGLELVRRGGDIVSLYGWVDPLIGLVIAFAFAAASIRWLLRMVERRSLAGFGWYRVAAAAATMALLASGRI